MWVCRYAQYCAKIVSKCAQQYTEIDVLYLVSSKMRCFLHVLYVVICLKGLQVCACVCLWVRVCACNIHVCVREKRAGNQKVNINFFISI